MKAPSIDTHSTINAIAMSAMFTGSQKEAGSQHSAETFIGPSVKLEGNFSGEGDVVVEGILLGTLATQGDVRVGPQATIEAQIHANNAHIAGKIKGNITVTGNLKVASTAAIFGDIKTTTISVDEGAIIQGKLSITNKKGKQTQSQEHERK